MTDLSKIDLFQAGTVMGNDDRSISRLERADLAGAGRGKPIHDQLGRRLRTVFPTPETKEDAFADLLKQISGLLP